MMWTRGRMTRATAAAYAAGVVTVLEKEGFTER